MGRARSHTRRWTGHDHVTHLGLDVHKDTIAVAILRPGEQTPDERTIPNTPEALRTLLARRRGRVVACYPLLPCPVYPGVLLGPLLRG
jgi:hypothetical protein